MKQMILEPIRHIHGEITLRGSKSISNRVLLLSALASGKTVVRNLLDSDDVARMLEALKALGVALEISGDRSVCTVEGLAGPFRVAHAELFLGNAGTAMRPLCAALCLGKGDFVMTGDARMCERPIGDLVDALRQAGCRIDYLGKEGYPPLRITAGGFRGGDIAIRGDLSSQFISALLLAAPLAKNPTVINVQGELVSKPYVGITLDLMKQFGVAVNASDFKRFVVPNQHGYTSPGEVFVEGDASAATYFLSAAAIRGGTVRVHGVGANSIQGDIRHADVLERMGAVVRRGPTWIEVSRGRLSGIDMDCNAIPDAAMTIAVTALFANGTTVLRNIYNWRVKETDRLAAMATELRKLGAGVTEGRDFLEIVPPAKILPATIDTYQDHRMAMAFSLAALGDARIAINDPDCVSKTFPDYFEKFKSIAGT